VAGRRGDHPVEGVVPVGKLLARDREADGVAEAEDLLLDPIAFGEVDSETKPVVDGSVP
jgi:hypothetical protein